MNKAAAKTAETIEFPTFDAEKTTDQFRAFTEKSVEQSREAYAKMKTSAETAQKAFESTFETVRSAGSELSLKAVAAARTNADAGFNHLEALIGARTFAEVLELQTAFLRASVETAIEQAKDFQQVGTKAASDVSKPIKDAFESTVRELKFA